MTLIDAGIEIELSELQKEKADSPRVDILQSLGKETINRAPHPAKQDFEISWTGEGIAIV
jgi:hypothetical protein